MLACTAREVLGKILLDKRKKQTHNREERTMEAIYYKANNEGFHKLQIAESKSLGIGERSQNWGLGRIWNKNEAKQQSKTKTILQITKEMLKVLKIIEL